MQTCFELKNEVAPFALINVGMVQESQGYPSHAMGVTLTPLMHPLEQLGQRMSKLRARISPLH